jgi:hypothetical protein
MATDKQQEIADEVVDQLLGAIPQRYSRAAG